MAVLLCRCVATAKGDAQPAFDEAAAVAMVRHTDVRDIDPTIESRQSLEAWLVDLGGNRSALTWEVNDCGEASGTAADAGRDLPICVEARARLAGNREIIVSVAVGSVRRGITRSRELAHASLADGFAAVRLARNLSELASWIGPRLVGLWDLEGTPAVHAAASASSPAIARIDAQGITLADQSGYVCEWVRDLDVALAAGGCVVTESGYEVRALVVYEHRGDWIRVAVDKARRSFGWVFAPTGFHPLADLVGSGDSLTHLTEAWDGRVYRAPRADASTLRWEMPRTARERFGRLGEVPYRARGRRTVAGRLWLLVEIVDTVCAEKESRVIQRGWIPAQSPAGAQWTWFSSRGC